MPIARLALTSCFAVLWGASALAQAAADGAPVASDGGAHAISELVIEYVDPNPQFPPPEEMAQLEVEFARVSDGLVGPRVGLDTMRVRIDGLPQLGVQRIYASAPSQASSKWRRERLGSAIAIAHSRARPAVARSPERTENSPTPGPRSTRTLIAGDKRASSSRAF